MDNRTAGAYDGTISQSGTGRGTVVKLVLAIALAVTTLVGCQPASDHRAPTQAERQQLVSARATSGLACHLEWDGPVYPAYEAICR